MTKRNYLLGQRETSLLLLLGKFHSSQTSINNTRRADFEGLWSQTRYCKSLWLHCKTKTMLCWQFPNMFYCNCPITNLCFFLLIHLSQPEYFTCSLWDSALRWSGSNTSHLWPKQTHLFVNKCLISSSNLPISAPRNDSLYPPQQHEVVCAVSSYWCQLENLNHKKRLPDVRRWDTSCSLVIDLVCDIHGQNLRRS